MGLVALLNEFNQPLDLWVSSSQSGHRLRAPPSRGASSLATPATHHVDDPRWAVGACAAAPARAWAQLRC